MCESLRHIEKLYVFVTYDNIKRVEEVKTGNRREGQVVDGGS